MRNSTLTLIYTKILVVFLVAGIFWVAIGWAYIRIQSLPLLIDQSITGTPRVWPVPSGIVRWYLLRTGDAKRRAKNSPEPLIKLAEGALPGRPLTEAEFDNAKPILLWLLKNNNGVNMQVFGATRATHGETALVYAAVFGQIQLVQLLLEHGADPTIESNSPDVDPNTGRRILWTPLEFAFCSWRKGQQEPYQETVEEIANALRSRGVTVDMEKVRQQTAFCRPNSDS